VSALVSDARIGNRHDLIPWPPDGGSRWCGGPRQMAERPVASPIRTWLAALVVGAPPGDRGLGGGDRFGGHAIDQS
jgi:hypothetical protein